jgi:hypothetical protein
MKKIFGFMILFVVSVSVKAQTVAPRQEILYGAIQKADLQKVPFADWFMPGYDNYHPDPKVNDKLIKLYGKEITIQVFVKCQGS